MGVLLKNNAVSRLGSSITSGSTSLSVTAGQGALFPSPGAGEWFPVTLIKATGSLEIVRCTARSGDVLTIARAQEGTAAQAFTAGDRVELRLTSAVIADVIQQITDLSGIALLDANNLADVADKAAARNNLQLKAGAVSDINTSQIDTTAGRLVRNGDFGLGSCITLGTGNVDDIVVSGTYQIGTTSTGTLPETLGELIHVERGSSGGALQIFATSTLGKFYMRSKWIDRGWDTWAELYCTRNVNLMWRTLFTKDNIADVNTYLGVVFTKAYESSEQNISAAGLLTLSHGLGVAPKLVSAVLVCKVVEHGYSVGDVVLATTSPDADDAGTYGNSVTINTTNILWRYGVTGVRVYNKSTGFQATVTPANWRLVVRAFA